MPTTPPNTPPRFYEIDALRGLCAIAVVFHHYLFAEPHFYWAHRVGEAIRHPLGDYRIQLFCMISGFAILLVLEKTSTPWDFVVARFSRLYPSYFVATLISAGLLSAFPIPGKEVTGHQVAVNLSMLQQWLGVKNVNLSYWYLAPELSFYAGMLIIFCSGQLKHVEAWGLAWLLFMALNENIFGGLHLRLPWALEASQWPHYGHLFFAGMLFYNLKTKGHTWLRHACLGLCFILQNMVAYQTSSVFSMTACLGIFYLFLFDGLKWIAQKPLIFLGSISYGLYLIHEMGYLLIRYLDGMGINPWLRFLIPATAAILSATLLTYGFERPVMNHIRRAFKS